MTKIVLSGIRLAAALIILTAVLGSTGAAHGSRMGAPVNGCSRELAGVVCIDRDGKYGNHVCRGEIGTCKTCSVYAGWDCRFGDVTQQGYKEVPILR